MPGNAAVSSKAETNQPLEKIRMALRKGRFGMDSLDGEQTFEGYTGDERWNGFACPRFTKDVGMQIMAGLNKTDERFSAEHKRDEHETMTYDVSKDCFIFTNDYNEDQDHWGAITAETEDGTLQVYPIGAWGWTWQEAEEEEPLYPGRPCSGRYKDERQDKVLAYFDKCLTACNRILAPLTKEFEVSDITEELIQHITTNMDTELCAIANGPKDDSWHELSDANKRIHRTLKARTK